jgi:Uma2 family endonuclease
MSTVLKPTPTSLESFENGEVMDQPTFHARYERIPGIRAELIGGEVHMPSPMKVPHSRLITQIGFLLSGYEQATPHTEAHSAGVTVILGNDSEPQPDLTLLILPEAGGQIREHEEYLVGAPELVIEVSSSPNSIDLHRKRNDYERYGVLEYLVFVLPQQRVVWFQRRGNAFEEQAIPAHGIVRVDIFPGLWLDVEALFTNDNARARAVSAQGVATPEHAAFVVLLQERVRASSPD